MFRRLVVGRWRQFRAIDIALHPKLTVVTGVNGSGKTTLLSLLGGHLSTVADPSGLPRIAEPASPPLVATPFRVEGSPSIGYLTDTWEQRATQLVQSNDERLARPIRESEWRAMEAERKDPKLKSDLERNPTSRVNDAFRELKSAMEGAAPNQRRFLFSERVGPPRIWIGWAEYGDGNAEAFSVPWSPSDVIYQVHGHFTNEKTQGAIRGVYVPSHRVPFRYSAVNSIPLTPLTPERFGQGSWGEQMRFGAGAADTKGLSASPLARLKEALLSLGLNANAGAPVQRDPTAADTFFGFEEVLRQALPPEIGFSRFSIRGADVVMITKSGEWPIDAASGGIAAIIDIAWRVFFTANYPETDSYRRSLPSLGAAFAVVIDEPEAHLHPAMQRTLLPGLLAAFPSAQFVVATHSPFIVGSVEDSHVYALRFDADRAVNSEQLDQTDKSGTANEILRETLGVPVTVPVWVARRIDEAVSRVERDGVTAESLSQMRAELAQIGLQRFMPDALSMTAARNAGAEPPIGE
jgi:energy-coupling factor transporter ATP-binding protein EcfA2